MQNYLTPSQSSMNSNFKDISTVPIYSTLGASALLNDNRPHYSDYKSNFDTDFLHEETQNPTHFNGKGSSFNLDDNNVDSSSNSENELNDAVYRNPQTPGEKDKNYSIDNMLSPYQPSGDSSNLPPLKDSESLSTQESSLDRSDQDQEVESTLKASNKSIGLPNLGNTCYMNSVLQCLFNTEKLCDTLEKNKDYVEKSAESAPITNRYIEALSTAFAEHSARNNISGSLKTFKKALERVAPIFKGYSQNDAHELFRTLIEKMHDELNHAPKKSGSYVEFTPKDNKNLPEIAEEWKQYSKDRDDSLFTSLFGGILLTEVKCESCGHVSYTFEDALDLSLNIANLKDEDSDNEGAPKSLYKCLNDFATPEFVDGYACDKCKRRDSSYKRTAVWKQPEVLVVQLKRFVYDMYGNRKAVKDALSFPLENLSLDRITHEDSNESKERYQLYGIVNHFGSLNFGHYIGYVYNDEHQSWYQYNDDQVTRIDEDDIKDFAEGASEPYILFYKKI